MAISFKFQKKTTLVNRDILKSFIFLLVSKERRKIEDLTFVFCDNDYLLDINRTNLKHDYFTDIITFDTNAGKANTISGEIYISVDMVRSNAQHYNVSFSNELRRVIFHGVLHLCGYMDKKKVDIEIMRGREDFYLKLYRDYILTRN